MQRTLLQGLIHPKGPIPKGAIKTISPVSGGCIHKAWHIELKDNREFFAKTCSKKCSEMLKFEAEGLKNLDKFSNKSFLEIPQPLAIKELKTGSILLLPWIEINVGNQTNLGKGLAMLHQASSGKNFGKFGWEKNGYIGTTIQKGGWRTSWGKSFVELRLIPQLRIAQEWGIEVSKYKELLLDIIIFLDEHNPAPSLVHGDLWSGNSATKADGKGVIFDPAIWWADREVDLAMTKLFGGFTEEFYKGYEEIWPIKKTNPLRTNIYNLYHIMNHANIFGGSYKNQSISLLKEISLCLKT